MNDYGWEAYGDWRVPPALAAALHSFWYTADGTLYSTDSVPGYRVSPQVQLVITADRSQS